MKRLPPDPRYAPSNEPLTWERVLVSYAMMAAIPLLLWVVSRPLAGTVVLASAGGLLVGARRASRLVRCFHRCRGFAFDLGERVRITVAPVPCDDSC